MSSSRSGAVMTPSFEQEAPHLHDFRSKRRKGSATWYIEEKIVYSVWKAQEITVLRKLSCNSARDSQESGPTSLQRWI